MNHPLLTVNNLSIAFHTGTKTFQAVNDVSFAIDPGETFGLVGESGCGKSVTALSIMRLVPRPPGEIGSGSILWEDRDLLQLPITDMLAMRGKEMSMIFQEPLTSFNPVQKIGPQIAEVLEIHGHIPLKEAKERVLEILAKVGIPSPARQYGAFPHELSGGMRQRAMIAMALICNPKLLIADEPTTALDVTIQAQIVDLLQDLQQDTGMAVLMITHNLGIVAEIADRVAVMYAGKLVEVSTVAALFRHPLHPYTSGLLKSVPGLDDSKELFAIPGQIVDISNLPPGCSFAPRCPQAKEVCKTGFPELKEMSSGHSVACWLYQ